MGCGCWKMYCYLGASYGQGKILNIDLIIHVICALELEQTNITGFAAADLFSPEKILITFFVRMPTGSSSCLESSCSTSSS